VWRRSVSLTRGSQHAFDVGRAGSIEGGRAAAAPPEQRYLSITVEPAQDDGELVQGDGAAFAGQSGGNIVHRELPGELMDDPQSGAAGAAPPFA
jgi:hypothetical protein